MAMQIGKGAKMHGINIIPAVRAIPNARNIIAVTMMPPTILPKEK